MKRRASSLRLGFAVGGVLTALLLSVWGCGCGGMESTPFGKLKNLPATVTGDLTVTAFGGSAPALGTLAIDGDSVLVLVDLEAVFRAGIRLAVGVEYRGEHTVTLEAAERSDPSMPQYRITEIQPPGSE